MPRPAPVTIARFPFRRCLADCCAVIRYRPYLISALSRLSRILLLLRDAVFGIRLLDAKLVEPVLQGSVAHAEHFGGLCDHPVRLLHGLVDNVAFEMLKINPLGWNFEPGAPARPF